MNAALTAVASAPIEVGRYRTRLENEIIATVDVDVGDHMGSRRVARGASRGVREIGRQPGQKVARIR